MFDFTELLYYKNKIYILFDKVIKNEFMKLHHNDVLAEHYKVDRIINLLFKKYYWVYWKKVDTYIILCYLVKSLNCVAYEHILIKRVTEEVKRMLTTVNVNKVFT